MKPRKAAVIFITVTLDMLALGLIAPVLPKLALSAGNLATELRFNSGP